MYVSLCDSSTVVKYRRPNLVHTGSVPRPLHSVLAACSACTEGDVEACEHLRLRFY